MRNLMEHPITSDEAVHALRSTADLLMKVGLVGDLRPLICKHAADFIEQNKEQFEAHVKENL